MRSASATPRSTGTAATPGTTAILLYTSGTTGLPKAVVVRHGGFSFAGLAFFAQVGYWACDILYTCLPLFHANALFLTTMQGLFSGYPVALGRRFSASRFWDDVRGLSKDYLVEKLFRDARAALIEDGTNEVLGLAAARMLTAHYGTRLTRRRPCAGARMWS